MTRATFRAITDKVERITTPTMGETKRQ